ncbi:hypothetical protein GOP47_0011736 [Adiantum capillus-veneris]|uniref:Uncharacterized protein n=2 Tax=Adiantum capillus-veneris TaxID=13818 RepID=A0A9D4UTB8_ADICA|nr:hypothetical protein GOP47_0011736 [Adiantum capillus-veneris]
MTPWPDHHHRHHHQQQQQRQETRWTGEQNKRFEQALALYCAEEEVAAEADGRWLKVAALVPGKSAAEVKSHYGLLLEDVAAIEAGKVSTPNYRAHRGSCSSPTPSWEELSAFNSGASMAAGLYPAPKAKASEQERKKGVPWTEEEHRLFLLGLDRFGKGDWRSISRNFVVSRTPTQVASHAQKYFIRLNSIHKEKRRSSIHDITNAATAAAASPPPPPTPSFRPLPPLRPGPFPPLHHHQ